MQYSRFGLVRPVAVALFAFAVAACGSSGSTSAPTAPPVSSSAPIVSSAPATQAVAPASLVPVVASVAPAGGTSDCPAGQLSGFQKYTINGFEAQHFCGPAKATVTLGSTTVQIVGGSCMTTGNSFFVTIGTEVFNAPDDSASPDDLVIDADATNGTASPGGVVNHTGWLEITAPVVFGPGKTSGSFSAATIEGPKVQVSFTC
jgi:hypothetical protein